MRMLTGAAHGHAYPPPAPRGRNVVPQRRARAYLDSLPTPPLFPEGSRALPPSSPGGTMNRYFLRALAAYLLPTFVLGYLWHLVLFAERYGALALYRAEVVIPFGLASMVIQGLVCAWAFPLLFPVGRDVWVRGAIRFTIVFGLLAWSFTTLPVAAKYDMTSIPAFLTLESAFTAVQFLIVAPLMALAYRGSVARVIRLRPDRPLARTG